MIFRSIYFFYTEFLIGLAIILFINKNIYKPLIIIILFDLQNLLFFIIILYSISEFIHIISKPISTHQFNSHITTTVIRDSLYSGCELMNYFNIQFHFIIA